MAVQNNPGIFSSASLLVFLSMIIMRNMEVSKQILSTYWWMNIASFPQNVSTGLAISVPNSEVETRGHLLS